MTSAGVEEIAVVVLRPDVFGEWGLNVGAARRWAAAVVMSHPPCPDVEALRLVVSELVTNAFAYSGSSLPGGVVRLSVARVPGAVRVSVTDDGPVSGAVGAPVAAESPGSDREDGRGLLLVAAMAAAWGVQGRPDGCAGRVVWCDLPVTGPGDAGPGDAGAW